MAHGDQSTANTIAAVVAALLLGIVFYSVWDLMRSNKKHAESVACEQNLRQLSLALTQYSSDWDYKFPLRGRWADSIDNKYLSNANRSVVFHCPAATSPYGYAMNKSAEGASIINLDDPGETVMLFETDSGARNADGGIADMAKPRHSMLNCSYCDGHTHWVNPYARSHWKWSNGG